jgi:endonuclease/exonuclease/phosphatase family metal-dependent hydrolase
VKLRVLTINVQNDEGDPRRLDVLNQGIRRLAPDLVALQEVLPPGDRSHLADLLDGTGLVGTHQADALAYAPPWMDRYGGGAVATRWPHRVVEVLDLLPRSRGGPAGRGRGAVRQRVELVAPGVRGGP